MSLVLLGNFITIFIFKVTSITGSDESNWNKRTHFDNFNVLLNLYKVKPLKKSQIYKSFSNRILFPNRNDDAAPNFDPGESFFNKSKATLSFTQLENIINANHSNNEIEKPGFDVENIDTEKFTIDTPIRTVNESLNRKEDFNYLFGNQESEDDHSLVTKTLPVNNTNSLPLLNTNDTFFKVFDEHYGDMDEGFSTVYPINANGINLMNESYNTINGGYAKNIFSNDDVVILR